MSVEQGQVSERDFDQIALLQWAHKHHLIELSADLVLLMQLTRAGNVRSAVMVQSVINRAWQQILSQADELEVSPRLPGINHSLELYDLGYGYVLNVSGHILRFKGKQVNLAAIEFKILRVLARARGRTLSKRQLENLIYPRGIVFSNTLTVQIYLLRKKLAQLVPECNDVQIVRRKKHPGGYYILTGG